MFLVDLDISRHFFKSAYNTRRESGLTYVRGFLASITRATRTFSSEQVLRTNWLLLLGHP